MTDNDQIEIVLPTTRVSLEERLGKLDIASVTTDPGFFYDPKTGVYLRREDILARVHLETTPQERDAIVGAAIGLGDYEILQRILLLETIKSLRAKGIDERKIKAYVKQTISRTNLNLGLIDKIYERNTETGYDDSTEQNISEELDGQSCTLDVGSLYGCFVQAQRRINHRAFNEESETFALIKCSEGLYFQILDQLKPLKERTRFKSRIPQDPVGDDEVDFYDLDPRLLGGACRLIFYAGLSEFTGQEIPLNEKYLELVRFADPETTLSATYPSESANFDAVSQRI